MYANMMKQNKMMRSHIDKKACERKACDEGIEGMQCNACHKATNTGLCNLGVLQTVALMGYLHASRTSITPTFALHVSESQPTTVRLGAHTHTRASANRQCDPHSMHRQQAMCQQAM